MADLQVHPLKVGFGVYLSSGERVATFAYKRDADLYVASRDMLEALDDMLAAFTVPCSPSKEIAAVAKACAAIAKAMGTDNG